MNKLQDSKKGSANSGHYGIRSFSSYAKNQVKAFKQSFKIENFGKLLLLDLSKYVLLIVIFLILLSATLKSLYDTVPLLNTVESIRDIPTDKIPQDAINQILAQKYMLNRLLLKLFLIFTSLIVFSSFVASYFNTLITDTFKKEKFHLKKFLNLSYIYMIFGFVLLAIFLLAIIYSHNLTFIFIVMMLVILLKLYIFSIFPLSIEGKSFISDLKNGLLYKLRLNRTIIPIIIGFLILIIGILLLFYAANIIAGFSAILIMIFLLCWSIWMKSYNYNLYSIYFQK